MVIYSREKVARLREQYPAGTRICLNSMDGEAGMPQGLEGTVQYVDDAGQLGVKWDKAFYAGDYSSHTKSNSRPGKNGKRDCYRRYGISCSIYPDRWNHCRGSV